MIGENEFLSLMEMLKKSKNIDTNINWITFIKKNASVEQLKILMTYLYKRKEFRNKLKIKSDGYNKLLLLDNCSANFTNQFKVEKIVEEIGFELNFLAVQFDFFGEDLQKFLQYRRDYECAFMRADYEEALSIVETVDNKMGYSFWGISSVMAASSYDNTRIRKVRECLLNECDQSLAKAFVKMSEYRFSKDITGGYFQVQLKNIIDEHCNLGSNRNLNESFKKYMAVVIDPTKNINYFEIKQLLIISSYLPLIDRYCLFEKILGGLCSDAVYEEIKLKDCIVNCAELVNQKLREPFWDNVLLLLKKNTDVILREQKLVVHKGLELFCKEKMEECYRYCEENLKKHPNNFALINLMAKCGDIEQEDIPYYDMAGFVRKLYMKSPEEVDFCRMIKLCDIYERFYSHFSFGTNLAVIIETETSPVMIEERKIYVRALIQYDFMPSKLAFFIQNKNREIFIQKYKELCGELYFSDWQISTYPEATPKIMQCFKCDKISLALAKIEMGGVEGVEGDEKLPDTGISKRFLEGQIAKVNFERAVAENDLLSAINIYMAAYFESKWLVRKMNIESVNEKITIPVKKSLEYELSYCIYAYLTRYQLYKGEEVSNTVVKSAENLLEQYNVEKTSQLPWPDTTLEQKEMAYFLEHICSYDLLRRVNTGLTLIQDIYDERICIIDRLLEYNFAGKDEEIEALKKERENLVTEIECLDIAACINKGKINTKWIVLSEESNETILFMFDKCRKEKEELYGPFIENFATIKKDYVQELNRILSINIRHGILENELFRFFRKGGITDEGAHTVTQNLEQIKEFKNRIYQLINELLKSYIIVSHKCDSDNKLVIYAEEDMLEQYFCNMPEFRMPEEVREYYLKMLDTILVKSLPSWGEKICNLIDERVMESLQILYDSADKNLQNYVKKTTDLWGEELEKLKQWFTVTQNQDTEYRLITLGDVLQQEWEYLTISSRLDDEIIVKGSIINFLYTIIRELIWNAEKYSDVKTEESSEKVIIQFDEIEDNLVIRVENVIAHKFGKKKILKDLQEIQSVIETAEKADSNILNKEGINEGRSGYKKIVKLLKRNYDEQYSLVPKFLEEQHKFAVTLKIDMEALTVC